MSDIEIKTYKVGRLLTNFYVVLCKDSKCGIMIDPGGEVEDLKSQIDGFDLKYIFLTHGHFDHILKAKKYRNVFGAKIVISRTEYKFTNDNFLNLSDRFLKPNTLENFESDKIVDDKDEICFGACKAKVIVTPGHTWGSVCYIIDDNIFSGDTLFKGQCGCTRFPTGSKTDMKSSLLKLYNLNYNFKVYPGHGDTTMLYTEKNNYTGL